MVKSHRDDMTLQHSLFLIVSESHLRLQKHVARLVEIDTLGAQSRMQPWKVCYNEDISTVTIVMNNSGRSVDVKLDWDYPRHSSCMEIVSVGPDGTFADVEALQVSRSRYLCCFYFLFLYFFSNFGLT